MLDGVVFLGGWSSNFPQNENIVYAVYRQIRIDCVYKQKISIYIYIILCFLQIYNFIFSDTKHTSTLYIHIQPMVYKHFVAAEYENFVNSKRLLVLLHKGNVLCGVLCVYIYTYIHTYVYIYTYKKWKQSLRGVLCTLEWIVLLRHQFSV